MWNNGGVYIYIYIYIYIHFFPPADGCSGDQVYSTGGDWCESQVFMTGTGGVVRAMGDQVSMV